MPERGENLLTRMSPESITVVTPSMVSDVSAMDVDKITRRGPSPTRRATTRSCSSLGNAPYSGNTSTALLCASVTLCEEISPRSSSWHLLISPSPGRKQRMSPPGSASARFTAPAICTAIGAVDSTCR